MSTPGTAEPTGAAGHQPDATEAGNTEAGNTEAGNTEADDEVSSLQDELDVANDCGPPDEVEPPGIPPE